MGGAIDEVAADSLTMQERTSHTRGLRSDIEEAYRLGERDFAKRELSGVSLAATQLEGAGLAGAVLARADLSHVEASRTDFERCDLREADFGEAVLVEANLSGSHASRACFDAARLERARLVGTRAREASFVQADLRGIDAAGSDFERADFSEANATGAGLGQADLRGARLVRTALVDANLGDADLRHANLEGADLSGADLRGALLSGTNFGRTKLGGAQMAEDSAPFVQELERLRERVEQARVPMTALIGLCVYVLVTAAGTTDAQLALNRSRVELAIVDAELPLQMFFVSAAAVTFVVSCYLLLHLARLIGGLRRLPRIFPDGSPLCDRVSPWLIAVAFSSWFADDPGATPASVSAAAPPASASASASDMRSTWLRRVGARLFDLGRWIRLAAFALLWGLAPFTTGVLLLRFMASQRALESYAIWAFLAASIGTSWLSFLGARRSRGRGFDKAAAAGTTAIVLTVIGCTPGVLMGIYPFHVVAPRGKLSEFSDGHVVGADLEKAPLVGADLRMSHLESASLWGARLDGADLTGAIMTDASGQLASFLGSNLTLANLTGAVLSKAALGNADLSGALLQRADLRHASLRNVSARGADFSFANAEGALFDLAVLSSAKFQKLHAVKAVFEGADLERADLSEAVLAGANLRSTKLAGAVFAGADVSEADFTGCMDLSAGQLCSATGWSSALLPGDEAESTSRPFRIDVAGPLRRRTEHVCGETVN